MLWKKESKRLDSLYVELCDVDDNHNSFWSSSSDGDSTESDMPDKDNALAKHYHQMAAEHCESKNWFEAIELYNQALCFAEFDTSAWAAILTDRSQCFFQLKMYNECLVDVKLAKTKVGAEIYMTKLNRLLAMSSQKRNHEQVVYQFQPTLSFDANKQIPCAANVVTIEMTTTKKKTTKTAAKCERIFQATRPIEVGKTILIEDAFVASTIERYKRCCICMRAATNLVPCSDCTNSLFCIGTCERRANKDMHRVECNSFVTKSKNDENNADLVIRSILMAFKVKPSVNGLLQFVEKVLFDKQYDALAADDFGNSAQSKYAIFLKNGQKMLHAADTDDDDFTDVIGDIYKTLMDNDEFSARIDLPDHRRFLMHLIGHHMCALRYPKLNVEISENDGTIVHSIFADFFKHSCNPNVVLVTSDRSIVAVTIRPIQKNEPLTVSYLPDSVFDDIGFARRLMLREKFKVLCKCERCEQKKPGTVYIPSKQGLSQQFQKDCENDSHFHHKMQSMRKKLSMDCVKFLNRNGGDTWNDDIDLVTTTYVRLLREKFYLNLQY